LACAKGRDYKGSVKTEGHCCGKKLTGAFAMPLPLPLPLPLSQPTTVRKRFL
jgi:hypothetical protein